MRTRRQRAAAATSGGAVVRILTQGAQQQAASGPAVAGQAAAQTLAAIRRTADGYDQIKLDSTMLGTTLAASGAFGLIGFGDAPLPARALPCVDPEVQAALSAGVSDLTIAGLPAHEFAVSLRYAHIPGANRVLRTFEEEPISKSFLVLFFKKERLAFFTSPERIT